ncbi:MAG: acyl-CoA reductase [Ruthenibacterium sp.]
MILANGRLYEHGSQAEILQRMGSEIDAVRAQKSLPADAVVDALDALSRQIEAGGFARRALALGVTAQQLAQAVCMLRRESVEYRLRTELGPRPFAPRTLAPPLEKGRRTVRLYPLGVLLHIAAGNADGLPVLSLAEGLVTGNINILKLPQADSGLSLELVQALIGLAPELADFIYVFDTPSSDIAAMRQMAAYSDGIVVWGGDAAVAAVRQIAPVGAKLIEWGHRLSFAYLSGYEDKARELAQLAAHIADTRQLLCSSCQVIFLDTEDMGQVHAFCEEFLPILEDAAQAGPPEDFGTRAQITLRRYAAGLEQAAFGTEAQAGRRTYTGRLCQLIACEDHGLELSGMFASCLVKRLPAAKLAPVLRRAQGRLQTAGLVCAPEKRAALARCLAGCGVVRITRAGAMSHTLCGEAHDGEYPLRRYVRLVETDE